MVLLPRSLCRVFLDNGRFLLMESKKKEKYRGSVIKKILGISLAMNSILIFNREKGIKKLRNETYFILSNPML